MQPSNRDPMMMDNNPPQQQNQQGMFPNQQPPMDPMMQDNMMDPGDPMGPGGPMGPNGGPPMGPPGMNGGMENDMGMMMDGPMGMGPDGMMQMGGPGGPGPGLAPDMMMDDPMMNPGMGPGPGPGMDGYFESSEYQGNTRDSGQQDLCSRSKLQLNTAGHEVANVKLTKAAGLLSLEDLDIDIGVSVKKIENREDEYGKVKQALLSDLNFESSLLSGGSSPEFDPASPASPRLPVSASSPASSPSFLPLLADSAASPVAAHSLSNMKLQATSAISSLQQPRSKDTLESIFGATATPPVASGQNITSEQSIPALQLESTESRYSFTSSKLLDYDSASYSSNSTKQHELSTFSKNPASVEQHQEESNSSSFHHDRQLQTLHLQNSTTRNNNFLFAEESFPVCLLSPELDALEPPGSGIQASNRNPVITDRVQYTIPELPEEEEGSPTTGDGVSRAKRPGKPYYHQFYICFH